MARIDPDRKAPAPPSLDDGDASDMPLADAAANIARARKASGVQKITQLVEAHPDEAVTVLRGWLHQSQ